MLCDAVQGLGRIDVPEGPDLVAVSAHKIHGPKAIGALWMRDGVEPAPIIHGGGQEMGIRSGTLSPALCVGFGAAAKLASERRSARPSATWNGFGKLRRANSDQAGRSTAARTGAIMAISTPPRGARRGAADFRPARHRFLPWIGLRKRIRAAEPRASRDRSQRPRGSLLGAARLWSLHDRGGADIGRAAH